MKILYLSSSIIPSRTANSINVMKMCDSFSNIDNDVTLIHPRSNMHFFSNNNIENHKYYGTSGTFNMVSLFSIVPFKYRIGKWFYAIISGFYVLIFRPNIVYSRSILSCYIALILKKRVIYECHQEEWDRSVFHTTIFLKMLKDSNLLKVVVISNSLRKLIVNSFKNHIASDQIIVAHDGADKVDDKFLNILPRKDNFVVGYFGHLYKGKGVEFLLKVASRMPDVSFKIYGGEDADIERCKAYATKNVEIVGFVPHAKTAEYRSKCHVLVAPYQKRVTVSGGGGDISKVMSPLKIFEYMSSKRPIVCSDIPVLREILDDNTAIFAKVNNCNDWVEAINKLKEPELANVLSERAYNKFLKFYTWNSRARFILNK